MKTPNIRAVLLACTALACGPQTSETAGETATTTTGGPVGPCALEPKATECDNMFVGYYFDPASMTCKSFDYGTCGGEVVPFKELENCRVECEACETDCSTSTGASSGG